VNIRAGGLMSHSDYRMEIPFDQLGVTIGRILAGAKPAEFPVPQPTG
jgi:hypothetical protein